MRIAPLVLLLVSDVAFAQAHERKELPKARAAQAPADKSREGKVWKGQEVVSKLGAGFETLDGDRYASDSGAGWVGYSAVNGGGNLAE